MVIHFVVCFFLNGHLMESLITLYQLLSNITFKMVMYILKLSYLYFLELISSSPVNKLSACLISSSNSWFHLFHVYIPNALEKKKKNQYTLWVS